MEFYLDDSLRFAMQLNRIPAEETKQIDLHYDLPQILNGRGKFQKLYLDMGNSLPFYENRSPGAGIINSESLSEGEHRYRIVCKDIAGNQTELEGGLLVNRKPSIQISGVTGDEIEISGEDLESVAKLYVFGKKRSEAGWIQHTLSQGRFFLTPTGARLPVAASRYDILKILAESKSGGTSSPVFYFTRKTKGDHRPVNIGLEIFSGYVQFTLTTSGSFTLAPNLGVREGDSLRSVKLDAVDLNKYVGAFVPSPYFAGRRFVHLNAEVNGNPTTAEDEFELYSIPTDRPGSFTLDNGELIVSYDSDAVFKPLHVRITKEPGHASATYNLEPQDVLLNRGVTVSLQCHADTNHLGLYFRANGGWAFQSSHIDMRNRITTTLTRTLGEIAIMRDGEAPTFGRLRVVPRQGKIYIAFRYHDNLSGVDTDEIKMYIDDTLVIPEIDGEHHRVWYQSDEPLQRGRHFLRIAMKDNAKNQAEISRSFTVK